MGQKVYQKWVPVWDQGALQTMLYFFLYKNPNGVLPIFLSLEYFTDFFEKYHQISEVTL